MTAIRNNLFLIFMVLAPLSIICSILAGKNAGHFIQPVIFQIRLPHALTAFTCGGLLALAGALMQALLRNPLADPYVLGLSGGAALVTLLLMFAGVAQESWLISGAWCGSLATMLGLFFLTKRQSPTGLLLTGVAFASGFAALISLILFSSPDHLFRSMLFWLSGDLSFASIPYFAMLILCVGLLYSLTLTRELNLLMCGEDEARSLGVEVTRLRWKLFFLSSFFTATAVTIAGCIGFVGLIVPHIFRLLRGSDHRFLLPGCVLLGGTLVTLVDMLSRTLFFPQILPVGIVMALLATPIFIILLQRHYA